MPVSEGPLAGKRFRRLRSSCQPVATITAAALFATAGAAWQTGPVHAQSPAESPAAEAPPLVEAPPVEPRPAIGPVAEVAAPDAITLVREAVANPVQGARAKLGRLTAQTVSLGGIADAALRQN